ncbi:beta strand repeat-containing protein [Luteolibacter luteus]|uniref:Autotransporter domain-containing protein n=1 Tax=Luteolibacter luteus TaxID=2728835 RepID=A0A858RDW0_9BACT|nr:autotransporter-associated beta strand repeat-containing protein [Luteolibacter luteus]QJE94768.1 hypothetical protein HHL09_02890 [Luteolibacter luteus]
MKKQAYPILAALIATQAVPAATFTWSGSTSGAWDPAVSSNWNGATPVFDNTTEVIFNGGTPISNYITYLGNGPRTLRTLSLQGPFASPLEIRTNHNNATGRMLVFSADSGSALLNVDASVDQSVAIGQGTGTNNVGTLSLASDLSIVHNGTGLLTISRPINESSAGRAIAKSGSGTVLLSAANTFTGNVTIDGGIVQLGNATALGTVAGDTIVNDGGTLDLNNQRLGAGESVSIIGVGQGGIGALYQTSGNSGDANSIGDNLILTGNASVGAASGTRYGIGSNGTSNTTGPYTLTKVGAGQFDLRGNVSIGDIVVEQGALQTQGVSVYNSGLITLKPGTEFRAFEITNPFPRDFAINGGKIYSASSTLAGDSFTGSITLDGGATLESNGDATDKLSFSGNIGESTAGSALNIAGTRRVVLSGTNTYTGATTVSSGTLQASGSFTSDITVNSAGTIDGEGITTGSLKFVSGSTLRFDPTTTGANQFLRAADVSIESSDLVAVVANAASSASGVVILRDGNGGLDLNNFILLNAGRASLSLGGAGGNSDLLYNFQAANLEWRGYGNEYWSTEDGSGNFRNKGSGVADNFYDRDNIEFIDAAAGTISLAGNVLVGNVTFKNTAGNDVSILPVSTETLDATSIAITSSGNVTLGASITGNTPITMDGSGTLFLTGASTSASPITVNSGTLQIGDGGSTGSVAAPIINNASVITNRSGTVTFGGVISGSGTFTQAGTGLTILTAENTYTGLTTVNAGVLQIGNGATGSIAGDVLNNAGFDINRSNDLSYGGLISGSGIVSKRGTGVLTLTGANTFSGGLNIYNGTLIAGDVNIGSGPLVMGPGTANVNTLSVTGGTIDNDIYFSNGGTGNKIINLASGYLDATLSGTIHFDADPAVAAGVSRISPIGGTIVVSGKMTGNGLAGFAKRQTGTVVITNPNNDYTGPTHIVDGGSLLVDGKVPGSIYFGEALGVGGTGALGGTLGGSGVIAGSVKLYAASKLSPGGTSASGVNTDTRATLTIQGNLDASQTGLGAGRIFMQLGALAGPNDRINVGGSLSLGAGIFGLTELALAGADGLELGTYTLISTSGGITGTLDSADVTAEVAPGLSGTLAISGNDIVLTVSAGNAYSSWAAGFAGLSNTDFEFDFDGDGLGTGLEWVLGGDPTLNDSASIQPTATASAGSGITLSFRREEDSIGVAGLKVEYGSSLGSWPNSVVIGAASAGPDANGVTVTIDTTQDPDVVTVTIPASNAASGKLFARLVATQP